MKTKQLYAKIDKFLKRSRTSENEVAISDLDLDLLYEIMHELMRRKFRPVGKKKENPLIEINIEVEPADPWFIEYSKKFPKGQLLTTRDNDEFRMNASACFNYRSKKWQQKP